MISFEVEITLPETIACFRACPERWFVPAINANVRLNNLITVFNFYEFRRFVLRMQRYGLEREFCNRSKSVICGLGKYLFLGIALFLDCFISSYWRRDGRMDT